MDHIINLDQTLVNKLQNLLCEVNPYFHELERAFEFITSWKYNEYKYNYFLSNSSI